MRNVLQESFPLNNSAKIWFFLLITYVFGAFGTLLPLIAVSLIKLAASVTRPNGLLKTKFYFIVPMRLRSGPLLAIVIRLFDFMFSIC